MSEQPVGDFTASEPVGDTSPVGDASTSSEDSGGGNPAWSTLLEKLPTQLHTIVKPVLSDWDKNYQGVQSKYSEVQSKFEPYSQFAENEIDPDTINQALQIMSLIEVDPQAFHTQLGEYYADQWGQGQQGQGQQIDDESYGFDADQKQFDLEQDPKFQEYANSQQAIVEYLASTIEQQQQMEADAQVESELNAVKSQYGSIDEQLLFSIAVANNIPLAEAAKQLNDRITTIRQQPRADANAPQVFSPNGGGVPSSQPDPAKMSSKETRALVAQILAQQKEQ